MTKGKVCLSVSVIAGIAAFHLPLVIGDYRELVHLGIAASLCSPRLFADADKDLTICFSLIRTILPYFLLIWAFSTELSLNFTSSVPRPSHSTSLKGRFLSTLPDRV